MKKRLFAAMGMLIADLGVFVAAAALLPLRGSFGFNGPWSHFVNSRYRWDVAWAILVAAVLVSAGAFLLLEGLGIFADKNRSVHSWQVP